MKLQLGEMEKIHFAQFASGGQDRQKMDMGCGKGKCFLQDIADVEKNVEKSLNCKLFKRKRKKG